MKQRGRGRPRAATLVTYRDLADYIARSGDTQVNIARQVGTSQATVSKVAAGRVIPKPVLALRLATYCRIPLDSFTHAVLAKRAGAAA
jgi:transcriptional regulator with XRE-family HTH domain